MADDRSDQRWVSLPFSGERLESVVHFGSGKDADLEVVFADGRRAVLPAIAVRLQIDGGVVVEVSSWDDVSLRTVYRAPGLTFHSGRISFSDNSDGDDDDEVRAGFHADVHLWLATGYEEPLSWAVQVQIILTASAATAPVSDSEPCSPP